jgi:hypothetical protein
VIAQAIKINVAIKNLQITREWLCAQQWHILERVTR